MVPQHTINMEIPHIMAEIMAATEIMTIHMVVPFTMVNITETIIVGAEDNDM